MEVAHSVQRYCQNKGEVNANILYYHRHNGIRLVFYTIFIYSVVEEYPALLLKNPSNMEVNHRLYTISCCVVCEIGGKETTMI